MGRGEFDLAEKLKTMSQPPVKKEETGMIKGIYSSEAAMRPKMARMEVLANNLANINTTGFKRDRVFVRMLEQSSAAAADGRGDMTGVTTGKYIDTTPALCSRPSNTVGSGDRG